MAGIEAAEELTDEQLDAMAGGELLKGEVNITSFYYSKIQRIVMHVMLTNTRKIKIQVIPN